MTGGCWCAGCLAPRRSLVCTPHGSRPRAAPTPKLLTPSSIMPSAAKRRMCGVPGCTKPDFHIGPCSGEESPAKRLRLPAPPADKASQRAGPKPAPKPTRRPRPVEAAPEEPPPEQRKMSSGLHRFYHTHRWGVPLSMGTVAEDAESDEELDETWRLRETEERIRSRGVAAPPDVEFMVLWNTFMQGSPPLVSDRAVPATCRHFTKAHAARLSTTLRAPLLTHLQTLCAHNLLRRDDVIDCMLSVDAHSSAGKSPARRRAGTGADVSPPGRRIDACESCGRPRHRPDCAISCVR